MNRTGEEHEAIGLYVSLCEDVKANLGTTYYDRLMEDVAQLSKRVATRGVTILMDDMPKVGKLFDKGLSSGFFDHSKIPHSLRVKGGTFIGSSLIHQSFRHNGTILDHDDASLVFFTRCLFYLTKKVRMESDESAIKQAMVEFHTVDRGLNKPTLGWSDLDFVHRPLSFHDFGLERRLSDMLRRVARYVIPSFTVKHIAETTGRHGPGAVSDSRSLTDKYLFPSWPKKLDNVFSSYWFLHRADTSWYSALPWEHTWGDDWPKARLIAVPKTLSKPRIIASEPTAHQWCQQALMMLLRRSLSPVARQMIDFNSQLRSRELAKLASISGELATIDLSAASDRLSCYVVERYFNHSRELLHAMHACRTTRTECPDLDGRIHTLRKFAAMGSAITFPVQSLVYAVIALTSVLWQQTKNCNSKDFYHLLKKSAGNVQVFGDDIILPKNAVPTLHSILHNHQMVMNSDKSHYDGHFRESCGMDAWKGYEVTPLYLSKLTCSGTPTDVVSWSEVSNNAHRMGLWHTASYMQSKIPGKLRSLIPISDRPLGCIRLETFCQGLQFNTPERTKTRWNSDLHHYETKVLVLSSTVSISSRECGHANLLQFFTEARSSEEVLEVSKRTLGWLMSNRAKVRARWVHLG
jgi:hypothetical protein